MIQTRTTLILGAGSSKPYGFPSGRELRDQICSGLADETSPAFVQLINNFAGPATIRKFREAFERSQMYSIDAFLARRSEFTDVGKAVIASFLMRNEEMNNLSSTKDDHWYQYLWNQLAESWDSLRQEFLAIVTFNYDRSLEYFLLEAMQSSFGKSESDCVNQLLQIPIFHVYGSLGEPAFLASSGRPYEPTITKSTLATAMSGIRVIPEQRQHDETFERAIDLLKKSSVICFLGFGYDRLNMNRLRFDEIAKRDEGGNPVHGRRICGTVLGMKSAEIAWAIRKCGSNARYFDELRCEEFLRTHGILTGY